MLTVQNPSLVRIITSTTVNVVRIFVIMDKLVPRRPTHVHTLLAPMLMVHKFLLVLGVDTVNVVRIVVVVLDKLVLRRPTRARTLLAPMLMGHNCSLASKTTVGIQ